MATLAEDQAAIQRRQKMAEMLMAQGAEPMETNQTAGGFIVPVSPLAGVAKIAQQLSGAYMAKQADKQASDLYHNKLDELSNINLSSPDASNKLLKMGLVTEALAANKANNPGQDSYLLGYDAKGNPFRFSKSNGTAGGVPDESTGKPIEGSALYSPSAIAARENAKQGQIAHVLEDDQGRKGLYSGAQANPAQYGGGKVNVDITPDASPEDRALLESFQQQTGGNMVKSQTPAEAARTKATAELPVKLDEKQGIADIENNQKLEQDQQKELKGALKLESTLSDMHRYLYPEGTPVRDKEGRLTKPDQQMILGNGPADRISMMAHEMGKDSPQASNTIALRREANQAVIGLMNGSLGSGISNADRDFIQSQVGILEKAQHVDDIYNAVADIEKRVNDIKNRSGHQTNLAPVNIKTTGGNNPEKIIRFDANGNMVK
ncbi:MAG: hypothetical protein ACXWAT_00615 [Methylobacter sp.]